LEFRQNFYGIFYEQFLDLNLFVLMKIFVFE
jgi:hypothetical protein